jgi:predicted RND superfamily exporter protein
MIADDMIGFIKSDFKLFGLGVLLLLILTLGLIFGRLRWICLPISCCAVSVIWMIGLLGLFGWEVTVVSSNFISLQLIMTMAITIHLIARYREMALNRPGWSKRRLILQTVLVKIRPCVYAVLTTIAGFASLIFCDMLPVIMFGWMMIAGLVVSLVVTFIIFPSVMMLLRDLPAPKRHILNFPLTIKLGNFTEKHGGLIVWISIIVLIVSLFEISKLRVENSFIDYFQKDSEIYQGMKVIDESLGGTTSLDVIIDFESADKNPSILATKDAGNNSLGQEQQDELNIADNTEDKHGNDELDDFDEFDDFELDRSDEKYWFTSDKINRIKTAQAYLDSLNQTGKVVSLANIVETAQKLNQGKELDSFDLALLYSETPKEFRDTLVRPYVSVEYNQARFWVRIRDSQKDLRRNELIGKIKTELPSQLGIDPENVHLTGLLVLYNNMLQSLFDSLILTFGITLLILTGMFFVLFRSLKVAIVAMIPNIIPIGFVLGLMGFLDIPLDMMTITIAAIGVGIAVDDTIHYIHRFRYEFSQSKDYIATMHKCHGSIGYAMYYTSVTIIIGFSILCLSNFVPTVYFGLFTSLAMFMALLAALTLLPRLLIVTKCFGKVPQESN